MRSIGKRIFIGSFLGFLLTIFIMQHDQSLKDWFAREFERTFQEFFNAKMSCSVDHINFFNLSITFSDVSVVPLEHSAWSWSAKKFILRCGLWQLLTKQELAVTITLHDYQATSLIKNSMPAIKEHIDALLSGPPLILPLSIESISMLRSNVHLTDPDKKIECFIALNNESKNMGSLFKSIVNLNHLSLMHENKPYLTMHDGKIALDLNTHNETIESCTIHGTLQVPQLSDKICFVSGNWHNDKGSLELKNENKSLSMYPFTIQQENGRITIEMQGMIDAAFFNQFHNASLGTLHGTCEFAATMIYDEALTLDGKCSLKKASFSNAALNADSTFHVRNKNSYGDLKGNLADVVSFAGNWRLNFQDKTGDVETKIASINPLHDWAIDNNSHCNMNINKNGLISGNYSCGLIHKNNTKKLEASGNFEFQNWLFSTYGICNGYNFTSELDACNTPYLKTFSCNNGPKKLIELTALDNNAHDLIGSIDLACVQQIGKFLYDYELQANGTVKLIVKQQDPWSIDASLAQGNIRIPYTYNVIKDAHATFELDPSLTRIAARNVHCSLHKGKLWCDRAVAEFDKQLQPTFIYFPLFFESCILHLHKDLLTALSGNLIFSYQTDSLPELRGTCLIEYAQLKENILSNAVQRQLLKSASSSFDFADSLQDIRCNISVQTMNPLQVKTAFLETDAKCNILLTNSLKSPKISGSINFISGTLQFPYKPLFLTHGKIQFDPNKPFDPLIECVAKNRIKNYNVALQVTGTAQDPHLLIESSPPLLEEQVLSLLLVGSKEDSLNVMVPAFVMHSINPLLFGIAPSNQGLANYFKGILKPLRHIHLIPTFTDQTGRGGLRGAFEVDVNDRLHALIQKNFSLTEDTLFELEYLLSDEIGVKLFRDERRDMGAEVEMRWKF